MFVFTKLQLTLGSWGVTNTNWERRTRESPRSCAVHAVRDRAAQAEFGVPEKDSPLLQWYVAKTHPSQEAFAGFYWKAQIGILVTGVGFVVEIYESQ